MAAQNDAMIADMSGSCSAYTLKASATVLDSVYRVLQCVCASCDWLLTSVEALPHREVTLALSPSPCMHVSLLYQARSLEDQLQWKSLPGSGRKLARAQVEKL